MRTMKLCATRWMVTVGMVGMAGVLGCATDIRNDVEGFGGEDDVGEDPTTTTGGADDAVEPEVGSSTGDTNDPDDDSTGDDGEDETTGDPPDGTETTGGGIDWPEVECVGGNDPVWVLGRDLESDAVVLHRLDPEAGTFELAATLGCLGEAPTEPVSLAVRRNGTAFISGVSAGALTTMPLLDADPCSGLEMIEWTGPEGPVSLAFRSNDLFDADTERLFAHGPSHHLTGWFGEVFHFAEGSPVTILDSANVALADLSGTGDGQLFGVAYGGELMPLTMEYYGGEPIAGSPEVGDNEHVAWGGAIYVLDEALDEQQQGYVSGLFRFALDGTAAYDLVIPEADFPSEVLSLAASTCAPTVFGG